MPSPYAALRIPDFRRLLLANGALTLAREAQIVVVGWQVFALTRDPLTLGLIGLAEALPYIGVALYAGHVADRAERRTLALAGTFGLLLSAVALLLLTVTPGAIRADRVWPVYLVIALSATARSFTRPALFALSAAVVPRELYPNAVAWRTSSQPSTLATSITATGIADPSDAALHRSISGWICGSEPSLRKRLSNASEAQRYCVGFNPIFE